MSTSKSAPWGSAPAPGHRLIIASMFLPDTIDFLDQASDPSSDQEEHHAVLDGGHYPTFVDSNSGTRPSSPNTLQHEHASHSETLSRKLHELERSGPPSATQPAAPASSSQHKPKSRGGSFSSSSDARKLNMTALFNEAASGSVAAAMAAGDPAFGEPILKAPAPVRPIAEHSRSYHIASGNNGLEGSSEHPTHSHSVPIPALTSDHGRTASPSDQPGPASRSLSPGLPSLGSLKQGVLPRSRRGSSGNSGPSGKIGSMLGSSIVASLGTGRERDPSGSNELSGTKTPGGRAGGKQGLMTPLSIIGDLAAKQGTRTPALTSTPGDLERHHPFGSGAVTPMRGSQTPGTSVRDSSRLSASSSIKPPPIQGLSRPSGLSSLHMTPSLSGDGRTPNLLRTGGAIGGKDRPLLKHTHSTGGGKVASAVASGTINDHGRSARVPSPPRLSVEVETPSSGEPSRPRTATCDSPVDPHNHHSPATPSASDIRAHLGGGQRSGRGGIAGHVPPAAPSSSWNRTKSRGPRVPIGSSRRTPSLGRTFNRRLSVASYDTDATSVDLHACEDEEEATLPPYEFCPNPSANGGLINAVNSLTRDRLRGGKLYVGTSGIETEGGWLGPAERRDIEHRFYKERESLPVWVEDTTFRSAYGQFCKQILWPTFHYTLPTQKGLDQEHDAFLAYIEVNKRFADVIVKHHREGDIIWVNDYHLLLVPQMLRERLPHATIGFFLHIAFPSSELFRCLSMRERLLRGMLGADMLGMQTPNFTRHFRQTVSRILQLEATPKGIQLDGSGGFVTVSAFPIGIDVRSLNAKRHAQEVEEWTVKLEKRYEGKKVIVGRDKLDWIKGVRQKLLAFEIFLQEHPEWVGDVVLIQIALATNEENEEVGEATDVVARINSKYSSLTYQPVVFLHVQDITFSQYLALLTIADAFLATSLREGMNLTTHEYVVCQEEKHRPLILSEFTGTYSGLRACIGINPWNTKQVAHAIHKALTMDEGEMHARWTDLHRTVVTQTAQHWITSLLSRLERARIEQQRKDNSFIPKLEVGQLVSEWRAAKTRMILLDLEDTLHAEDPLLVLQQGFELPASVYSILQELTADRKNAVYVLSERGTMHLDQIARVIPRIGLVAENGCFVKHCGEGEHQWTSLVAGFNMHWRAPVKEILSYFTERTPGSWLEDRGASICWHFWSSALGDLKSHEAQWSRRQAAEVQNLIYDSLGERFSLRIIPGATSFLIVPKNTSRASAVQHILSMSAMGMSPVVKADVNPSGPPQLSSSTPGFALPSSQAARMSAATTTLSSPSPYKQPSNYWPSMAGGNGPGSGISPSLSPVTPTAAAGGSGGVGVYASPFGSGISRGCHAASSQNGFFDFVLCIGQDDALHAYVNGLDLPFAPLTCTTAGNNKGSEAGYHLSGGVAEVQNALEEIIAFRARDAKWGGPAMVDV